MPARSPSASSSAWPSTMPTSSTVWCAPICRSPSARRRRGRTDRGARAGRACGRRSRRRSSARRRRRRRGSSRSEISVSPVSVISPRGSSGSFSPMRASIDSPWTANPSARATGDRGASASSAGRHRSHPAIRRRKWPPRGPRRSAPRRPSAGRGSSRRRSRRTRSPAPRPTNTQPAARTFGASPSASVPDQLEVLGGDPVRQPQRRGRVVDEHRGERRAGHGGPRGASSSTQSTIAVQQLRVGRDRDHEAVLAVLGLGQQVERHEPVLGPGGRAPQPARSDRRGRRCRPRR